MNRKVYAALLLAAALFVGGCDNEIDNPTEPEEPAPTTTETFEGTIAVNGGMTHTFTTAARGNVIVTLEDVTPDPEIAVGLILGTWNGIACATSIAMDAVLKGNQVIGTVSGAGTLCVRIHDNGKLIGPLGYKIIVEHP